MLHDLFGEMIFNIGWKTTTNIRLFGKEYPIILKFQAYFEEDGITVEQKKAYKNYIENEVNQLKLIEHLLNTYSCSANQRFIPKTLLFERDGSYVLLCDDHDEPDEGIAVCLSPKECIISQDDYL